MKECPHCGLALSCQDGTLLAWCSTCLFTLEWPDFFYRKPTWITVWARDKGSLVVGEPWLTTRVMPTSTILFHPGDKHSSTILIVVDGDSTPQFDSHLIGHARTLLISKGVRPEHANDYRVVLARALERTMP